MKLQILTLILSLMTSTSFAEDRIAKPGSDVGLNIPQTQKIRLLMECNARIWSSGYGISAAYHEEIIAARMIDKYPFDNNNELIYFFADGFYKTKRLIINRQLILAKADKVTSTEENKSHIELIHRQIRQEMKTKADGLKSVKIDQSILEGIKKDFCVCEGYGLDKEILDFGQNEILRNNLKVIEDNGDVRSIKKSDFRCADYVG